MQDFLAKFTFDFWTIWGLAAQGMYFMRFVVQWFYSEKAKKVVVPIIFWYISLFGACMTITYALARYDIVFLIAGSLQIILYSRNLHFAHKTKDVQ